MPQNSVLMIKAPIILQERMPKSFDIRTALAQGGYLSTTNAFLELVTDEPGVSVGFASLRLGIEW